MENLQKLLTAMAVGYIRKSFVWDAWLGSECVWNLFFYLIYQLLTYYFYLFIHLFFY